MTNIFRWGLIFSLALFFGACSKAKAPTGNVSGEEAEELRPWEKLQEIDHSWLKLEISTFVENDKKQRNEIKYDSSTNKVSELLFKPKSGKFKGIYRHSTEVEPTYFYSVGYRTEDIDSKAKFKVYCLINGKLMEEKTGEPTYMLTQTLSRQVTVGDVLSIIIEVKDKDGKAYKYTVPPMKFADAN